MILYPSIRLRLGWNSFGWQNSICLNFFSFSFRMYSYAALLLRFQLQRPCSLNHSTYLMNEILKRPIMQTNRAIFFLIKEFMLINFLFLWVNIVGSFSSECCFVLVSSFNSSGLGIISKIEGLSLFLISSIVQWSSPI